MPGLLDARGGFNDPITMGLLGASQALLTPMSQGGGLGAAFGAFPAAQQAALKNKYLQQQMEDQQAETEFRRMQVLAAQRKAEKDAELQAMIQRRLGSPSASALAHGANQGSVGPTNANAQLMQQGGGFPFAFNDLLAIKAAGGPDFLEAYKFANTPIKMESGSTYVDPLTKTERFMPRAGEGMNLINGQISPAPGYLPTLAAVTEAQEGAKARFNVIPVETADGRKQFITAADIARRSAAPSAPAPTAPPPGSFLNPALSSPENFPRVSPATQKDRDGTRRAILQDELNKAIRAGDPGTAASVQRELDALEGGSGFGKPSSVAQAEVIRAERARAGAGIDADAAKNASAQASGAKGVVMIADQIERLIGDPNAPKVYGNAIPDRIAMGLNAIGGNETPKAVNTNQVRMLGQQMVLARGSLGAGVSVADADRYDKAAGDFSRAKTVPDMIAAVRTMRDIAKTYSSNETSARQQLESGQSGNVLRYNPKNDTFTK
jgi:hypothetical protein